MSTDPREAAEVANIVESITEGLAKNLAQWQGIERDAKACTLARMSTGEKALRADFIYAKSCTLERAFYERAVAFDAIGAERAHSEWKTFQSEAFDELHLFRDSTRNFVMIKCDTETGAMVQAISGDDNMAKQAGDLMLERDAAHTAVLNVIRAVVSVESSREAGTTRNVRS